MRIPIVTGTGQRLELDSEDYGRLVLLPVVCGEIDPHLWDLFAEPQDRSAGEPTTRAKTTSASRNPPPM